MLGWFSTYSSDKAIGKLRQVSDETYFITTQTVIEKFSIQHAKLFLQLSQDFPPERCHSDGHRYDMCSWQLNNKEYEVPDNLQTLKQSFR